MSDGRQVRKDIDRLEAEITLLKSQTPNNNVDVNLLDYYTITEIDNLLENLSPESMKLLAMGYYTFNIQNGYLYVNVPAGEENIFSIVDGELICSETGYSISDGEVVYNG